MTTEDVAGDAPGRPFGWRQRLVTIAVLAAVVLPLVGERDSFPLSRYPMYAGRRAGAATLVTAVGIDRTGDTRRLSLGTIAETDDPLIAEAALRDALEAGRAGAWCEQIARRADPALASVEIVEEDHDTVARATGKPSLLGRRVVVTCPVDR